MTTETSKAKGSLARHRVRNDIEVLIISGVFHADQRLTQQDLAKRFEVAQSVVREALLELQFSGLVYSIDNLGMFVSPLDAPQLLEAYQVREMLDGMAAKLCCQQVSRADIQQLTHLANRIHDAGALENYTEMGLLDREFHEQIIRTSTNSMLLRLTEGYRVLGMAVQAKRPIDLVHQEHLAIVQAIEKNHPNKAEQFARQHVASAGEALKQRVNEDGFSLDWVICSPLSACES